MRTYLESVLTRLGMTQDNFETSDGKWIPVVYNIASGNIMLRFVRELSDDDLSDLMLTAAMAQLYEWRQTLTCTEAARAARCFYAPSNMITAEVNKEPDQIALTVVLARYAQEYFA